MDSGGQRRYAGRCKIIAATAVRTASAELGRTSHCPAVWSRDTRARDRKQKQDAGRRCGGSSGRQVRETGESERDGLKTTAVWYKQLSSTRCLSALPRCQSHNDGMIKLWSQVWVRDMTLADCSEPVACDGSRSTAVQQHGLHAQLRMTFTYQWSSGTSKKPIHDCCQAEDFSMKSRRCNCAYHEYDCHCNIAFYTGCALPYCSEVPIVRLSLPPSTRR